MIFWRCCVEAAVLSRTSTSACKDTRSNISFLTADQRAGGSIQCAFVGLAEFSGHTPATTDSFTLAAKADTLRSINHLGFRPYGLGGGVGRGRRVGRGLGVTLGVEVGLTLGEGLVVAVGVAVGSRCRWWGRSNRWRCRWSWSRSRESELA